MPFLMFSILPDVTCMSLYVVLIKLNTCKLSSVITQWKPPVTCRAKFNDDVTSVLWDTTIICDNFQCVSGSA